ncbi:MAG: hypothetical protein JWN48_5521 [Myxococcaceae bacterium]|nr:hypothetical protein [Myxococcaceae bacterium]
MLTMSLSVAEADAQELPPSTAPSGITTIDPAPSGPPPAPPAAQPAPPPAPTVIVIEPRRVDAPAAPVVAVVAPPVAPPAPTGPAWSPVFTGSYFTRYELRSGYDDLNISSATSRPRFLEGDAIYYRLRFGIGTGLLDIGNGLKVGVQFTPQATGVLGNLTNSPSAPNTTIDANLGLHEGYARVQGKHARFDAGRFEMNYGDALVLGNLDWNETARSFDALRLRLSADSSNPALPWVDVFASMLDEGRPDVPRGGANDQLPGIGQGDVYFLGAYGAFGPAIMKGLDLDLYSFVRAWGPAKGLHQVAGNLASPTYNRGSATEATFGARSKAKFKFFDYRTEAGVQTGSRPRAAPAATAAAPLAKVQDVNVLAYQADLELGISFAEDKYRVALEGIYASGDKSKSKNKNEGWDELYPTNHKFLGLGDVWVQNGQKRTNTASGVLHLTANPFKPLTFQIDGHIFARPQKNAQTFNERGFGGGEIDAGLVYLLGKGLKVRATYAIFLPDSNLYHDVLPVAGPSAKGADPVQWCELELRYDLMP